MYYYMINHDYSIAAARARTAEMFQLFDHDKDGMVSKQDLIIAGALDELTSEDVLESLKNYT